MPDLEGMDRPDTPLIVSAQGCVIHSVSLGLALPSLVADSIFAAQAALMVGDRGSAKCVDHRNRCRFASFGRPEGTAALECGEFFSIGVGESLPSVGRAFVQFEEAPAGRYQALIWPRRIACLTTSTSPVCPRHFGVAGRGAQVLEIMVGVRGFEPPTPASRRQCSTMLSYTPIAATAAGRRTRRRF